MTFKELDDVQDMFSLFSTCTYTRQVWLGSFNSITEKIMSKTVGYNSGSKRLIQAQKERLETAKTNNASAMPKTSIMIETNLYVTEILHLTPSQTNFLLQPTDASIPNAALISLGQTLMLHTLHTHRTAQLIAAIETYHIPLFHWGLYHISPLLPPTTPLLRKPFSSRQQIRLTHAYTQISLAATLAPPFLSESARTSALVTLFQDITPASASVVVHTLRLLRITAAVVSKEGEKLDPAVWAVVDGVRTAYTPAFEAMMWTGGIGEGDVLVAGRMEADRRICKTCVGNGRGNVVFARQGIDGEEGWR